MLDCVAACTTGVDTCTGDVIGTGNAGIVGVTFGATVPVATTDAAVLGTIGVAGFAGGVVGTVGAVTLGVVATGVGPVGTGFGTTVGFATAPADI